MRNESSVEQLSRWWCVFNTWGWADDFPLEKPSWFDDLPEYLEGKAATKYWVTKGFMDAIKNEVGMEELDKHWKENYLIRKEE